MATKPFFLWGDTHATSTAAPDSDVGVFRSSATQATAAGDAPSAPELGAAAVARPRLRRADASGPGGKKKQQAGAGGGVVGANKKPQRGLGVAELERLRCGGDPLLELSTVAGVGDAAAAAQGHPMLHYHHPHHRHPHSAFEAAAGARYCSQLLAPAPPGGPVCALHSPPVAAGCQRAPVAPEQQYFRDRWTSRIGGFTSSGGGADHQPHCQSQSQSQLLPPATLEPEHPSSQSTIWRPAVSSSSSCLHTGHRCGICSRVNHPRMRALAENNGVLPLAPTPPDYSIYDLATAMATARQGDAPLAEPPAKKEVREIEFFPAASAHQRAGGGGGRVSVPDEPAELAAPFSSPYGAAASHTAAPQLDLSLRL